MSLFFKIILILFGLAYFISPLDLVPDLLPYLGYLDDLGILTLLFYILKTGQLPGFFPKRIQELFNTFKQFYSTSGSQRTQSSRTGASRSRESASASFRQRQKTQDNSNGPGRENLTPHQILGVSPNATKEQIQAAYREAIKKYHPDKVSHLGEEFQELANRKFVEIQSAYDFLSKHM